MDQELMLKASQLNKEYEETEERLGFVSQQLLELTSFDSGLDNLARDKENDGEKEILASLGKGIFIKSLIREKRLFVDIGSGILVKKSIGETKKIISNQLEKLNEMKTELEKRSSHLVQELQEMLDKIQKNQKP